MMFRHFVENKKIMTRYNFSNDVSIKVCKMLFKNFDFNITRPSEVQYVQRLGQKHKR